jgi:hypothetical protein
MHVISASRRTDIPAFHSDWFMHRVRKGFVSVSSPYSNQLFQVSLHPTDVIAIVFWTKNAAPMLPHFDKLSTMGYCFTFLYTINNYPTFLEPLVPEQSHTLRVVESVSQRFGPFSLRWRYDTIVLCEGLDRDWHLRNFRNLCGRLSPYTDECIFSFCDYYKKTTRNMDRLENKHRVPEQAECIELSEMMADIASEYGITLSSCAHDFLVSDKIMKGRCIDPRVLASIVDSDEKLDAVRNLRSRPTRKECGCFESKDIGAYDTCGHGCAYCYANTDIERALRNLSLISPENDCLDPMHACLAPCGKDKTLSRD